MNEKFNKNAKVEQLTKVVLNHGEEKGLIVKDPFQIFKFMVFTIFISSKAWNLQKNLKILFFVFYDTSYIQNTGNGNNYLNLPINLNTRYFLKSICNNHCACLI